MAGDLTKSKRVLFVDDDPTFLALVRELFATYAKGGWEIFTAENHAQALAELQRQRLDLAVLDVGMPVMDGIQFLLLLRRTHPDLPVMMLTGNTSETNRQTCLENGAALFLQKPTVPGDYATVFAALDLLATHRPGEGFRGVMKRVGLHEVLQFECLGKRSSILEIFTGKVRGRIHIADGAIIHAESGSLLGEVALYSLLALRGGEFNLLAFAEPPQRTIEGSWEMLLMEAARLSDEAAHPASAETPGAPAPPLAEFTGDVFPVPTAAPAPAPAPMPAAAPTPAETAPAPRRAQFITTPAHRLPAPPPSGPPAPSRPLEVLLCSGAGEVLYDWQCPSIEQRLALMQEIEQHATKLSSLASVGRFERLEVVSAGERTVCQIHPQRRLFVRSGPRP